MEDPQALQGVRTAETAPGPARIPLTRQIPDHSHNEAIVKMLKIGSMGP